MVVPLAVWDAVGVFVNVIMTLAKVGSVLSLLTAKELRGVNGWACWLFSGTCAIGLLKSADLGLYATAATLAPMLVMELVNAVLTTRKRRTHWLFVNRERRE